MVTFDISVYPNGAKLFHGQSHLGAQLNKILKNMMDVKAATCGQGVKPQISVAFYVPNAETPVSSLFQIYSPDIALNLRTTNVTRPSYLKSPVIESMWEIFKNKDAGKAKVCMSQLLSHNSNNQMLTVNISVFSLYHVDVACLY